MHRAADISGLSYSNDSAEIYASAVQFTNVNGKLEKETKKEKKSYKSFQKSSIWKHKESRVREGGGLTTKQKPLFSSKEKIDEKNMNY